MTGNLDREMWRRICGVLEEVMDLPRAQRSGRVRQCCAGSPELERWVEALLAAGDAAGDFLERPPGGRLAQWIRRIAEAPGPPGAPIPCSPVRRSGES